MTLRSLWSYMFGYVIIKIKGARLEEFLNRAAKEGIPIWDLQRIVPGFCTAAVSVRSFRRLRPLVRRLGLEISIVKRVGLPFLVQQALGRPGFLLGIGLCGAVIIFLSGFIWFVDVEGTKNLDPKVILREAEAAGLKPGIAKRSVDLAQVENHLLTALPELAWVGVELQGTMATLRVVEKVLVPEEATAPGDVVAAKSGLIQRIITFRGVPLVREGDTVVAGQVLISGQPYFYDEAGKLHFTENGLYQRADGIVIARVWYEAETEVPLLQVEEIPTGRFTRYWSFHWSNGRMVRIGTKTAPYEYWIEKSREITLGFGEMLVPFKVMEHRLLEVERVENQLSAEDAAEAAVEAAKAAIVKKVPKGVELEFNSVEVSQLDSSEGPLVRAYVVAEALENIRLLVNKK